MELFEKEKNKMLSKKEDTFSFEGFIDRGIRFIESFSLLNAELWKRFAEQFVIHSDCEGNTRTWKGEYWGKMMRGACFIYSYTKNEELYAVLAKTNEDLMNTADENGRISTYTADKEFEGWDIWCRKYVILGMQYFVEICRDSAFKLRLIDCMCRQVDYIMQFIGSKEEGKTPITDASRHWRGANSVSILEPIVRLYKLTCEKKYLDFAEYIVSTGGTSVENVFELAYEDKLYPYQYPVTKAYEMTSCFEGLLEYYLVAGGEKYKTAIINYANKILESDFTVIGCAGCTHELFDHSSVRQANTTNGKIMQETCVTVTLMKFMYELTMLTGNSKYADAFERSLYNAYWGAINTEGSVERTIKEKFPDAVIEPLPFDSYSPLTAGTRGNGVGGLLLMPDNHYFGCCACIGAAGAGLIPKMALMHTGNGVVFNLFINGVFDTVTPSGKRMRVVMRTGYPADGKIAIKFELNEAEEFEVLLRNPCWSKTTRATLNGEEISVCDGYIKIAGKRTSSDEIIIETDMRTRLQKPKAYGSQVLMNKVIWGANYIVPTFDEEDPLASKHIALQRGPIVLAAENRLGYSVDSPFDIKVSDNGYVEAHIPESPKAPFESIIELEIPKKSGGYFTVTDYASAGKLWNEESKMAAWILAD